MTDTAPRWVMPVPADVPRHDPLSPTAIYVADPVVLADPLSECKHLLTLATCSLCMDELTGRPTPADKRAAWTGRKKRDRKVPTDGIVRPADPSEWTYDEWMADEHKAHRAAIMKDLRANERDRYPGRTCGEKDRSIKPINRR